MRIKKKFVSFVGLLLFLVASNPSLGQIVYGPPVRTTDVKLHYTMHVESVRDVDFKSFWYDTKGPDRSTAFLLRNGEYSGEKTRQSGGNKIELVNVQYF